MIQFPPYDWLQSQWPARLIRWLVSLIFIYAGAVKLMDPRAFARTLSGYGLIPDALLAPVAIGLSALELLAGAGLFFNVRGSLKVIAGLVLLFLGVLGFAIVNELDVDCGCFSADELHAQRSLRMAFYRDIVLMLCIGTLMVWERVQNRERALEAETD